MRFDSLRLVGATSVNLPVIGASGPFVFKGAEGLGPTAVDVQIAETVLDFGVYQGKKPANRVVTIIVGLDPEWDIGQTPEELRTILYGLLSPKPGRMVELWVQSFNTTIGVCRGQIARMEPTIFDGDPACQIVLECTHPYIEAPATINQAPARNAEQLNGVNTTWFTVANEGTAPAGFVMSFVLTQALVGTTLVINDYEDANPRIEVALVPWAAGDRFTIDTNQGSRGAYKTTPSGVTSNLLNNLTVNHEWLELYGGPNKLRVNVGGFNWYSQYQFYHKPKYWGV